MNNINNIVLYRGGPNKINDISWLKNYVEKYGFSKGEYGKDAYLTEDINTAINYANNVYIRACSSKKEDWDEKITPIEGPYLTTIKVKGEEELKECIIKIMFENEDEIESFLK